MSDLQFYYTLTCPYAQRSWITLLELGVDFEPIIIELGTDNKTDWFLALNPYGKVPVIKHNDSVIYESLIVDEYLAEVFTSDLMPSDAGKKAWARILMSRCDANFNKSIFNYLSHKKSEDSEKDEQSKQQLKAELRYLETVLQQSGGPYFLGEDLSLVDITYIPFFQKGMVALSAFKDFEMDAHEFPFLQTWLGVMNSRSSCQETMTSPEIIKEIYARFLKLTPVSV